MGFYNNMDVIKYIESKIDHKVVLVIAGNYREFLQFINDRIRDFNISGMWEGYEFIYYSNETCVRGVTFDKYFCYGTFLERSDIDWDYIKISIRPKVEDA